MNSQITLFESRETGLFWTQIISKSSTSTQTDTKNKCLYSALAGTGSAVGQAWMRSSEESGTMMSFPVLLLTTV